MKSAVARPSGEIVEVRLTQALSERYLNYALSTIMSRSLPDLRDGLKPVHRRLIFAMQQLRLDPTTGFKKSARVVGDVIGKFHPHGDQSIYDALVRLAQDFSLRYPLIDGQGNFGNIDGDNAAAMRYTEARLTPVAMLLLEGIDENAVDFRPTYDGESEEPVILPGAFPNLLANGSQGIAVGMATSIPPHNAAELCDALLHLIKAPNATFDKLVELVPGPDFPAGGVLVEEPAAILEAYKTGRGAFRLRARYEVERHKGGGWQVVVTQMPYQVQKAKLVERIAELLEQKKLVLLEDVRDESAETTRLVLVPKSRNVDPEVLMEQLFRQTELEVRIPLNLNVLDADNVPRVMNLREALRGWLLHRQVVLQRRTTHRLEAIARRLEILAGYLIAYLDLDEVIRIIRESDEPKPVLVKRFKLTDNQAEAILNMRLRALRKLEEIEIKGEHRSLSVEQKDLKALLKDESLQWQKIAEEVRRVRELFGPKTAIGRRRTEIAGPPAAIVVPLEAVMEREPVTVLCSSKGWVRAAKGHLDELALQEAKYKEGDLGRFALACMTTDKLLAFATNGRFYTLAVDKLPGGRGFGEPIRLLVDMPNDADIVALRVYRPGEKLLLASGAGYGFVVSEDEVLAQTRAGKQVMNLGEGEEAVAAAPVEGDFVAVVGENRKLLLFPLAEVPEMGRGRGVRLQRYQKGGLSDAKTFTRREGLTWNAGAGRVRTETDIKDWLGQRAQAGRLPMRGFPSNNKF
jgi:topoisomerase-4 subunit A